MSKVQNSYTLFKTKSTEPRPPKGSEVFVGKIPRSLQQDDLLPVFESVAPVHEMRLMINKGGQNRGFAFVTYTSPDDASKAIKALNNYEIRPKQRISVIKSLDNCRLFLGGIPKDKSEDEVHQEMSRITSNIVRVIVYSSVNDKTKNRGFAFVEYESHKAAAIARRNCASGDFQLWGKSVAVDWAEPEPVVDEEILSKVQNLYVRNILVSTREKDLEKLFNDASDGGVDKVKVIDDYAFVNFKSREQAERALASLQHYELNGVRMQISWARPVVRKDDQAIINQPDIHVNSNLSLVQNRNAIGNFSPSVAHANLPYSLQAQHLSFIQLPTYHLQPVVPGTNPFHSQMVIPMHGVDGSYSSQIPPAVYPWANSNHSNELMQTALISHGMYQAYDFSNQPPPHLLQSEGTLQMSNLGAHLINNRQLHYEDTQGFSLV